MNFTPKINMSSSTRAATNNLSNSKSVKGMKSLKELNPRQNITTGLNSTANL